MAEVTTTGSPSSPSTRSRVAEATIVVLVLLAAVGVGVTNLSPQYGLHYWLVMAPIFGATNLLSSWTRARGSGQSVGNLVAIQVLHWAGSVLAIYMVFVLFDLNWITDQQSGVLALLVLALASFLSGVHTDWHFCVIGLVLGAVVALAALVQDLLWMLALPLGVVALVGIVWWLTRRSSPG